MVDKEHYWELNRENIKPLRGGRNVHAINHVFSGKLNDFLSV